MADPSGTQKPTIAAGLESWRYAYGLRREAASVAFSVSLSTWIRWVAGEGYPDAGQIRAANAIHPGLVAALFPG